MATWVIGDVHGCWTTLRRLLEKLRWDPAADSLWLVGDLVNKGPGSVDVLRWARRHDDRITAVLGNHDLHLLARVAGAARPRSEDTLDDVLTAPDRSDLLAWLRARPLMVASDGWVMVHAGVLPGWTLEQALALAASCREALADDTTLREVYAQRKTRWGPRLEGARRIAAAVAVFTRLRLVGPDDLPRLRHSGPPHEAPDGCRPWYVDAGVIRGGRTVVFGHWAMHGFRRLDGAYCMDEGCVYGTELVALRRDDGHVVRQEVDPEDVWRG